MIPNNRLSDPTIKSYFLYPDNIVTPSLVDYEMGGIALQDTSQGLEYQAWKGYWDRDTTTAYLVPVSGGTPIAIFTEPDVLEFSFTFDQNMRWSATTLKAGQILRHRWYDSLAENYVITDYTEIVSAKLALDDKRAVEVSLGNTDIILSYLKENGTLCWRVQRDRFQIETVGQSGFPPLLRITNFGMNNVNRLQWRLSLRRF